MSNPVVAQQTMNRRSSSKASLAGIRVLLVEDDIALQEAIVDTLELAGCDVKAVPSAEQALELLGTLSVDMVVTDVNMKGMDGHQLLSAVRDDYPFLPVLLITAYASIERSVDAIKNGAVDYLVKPFEPGALIELILRYASNYPGDKPGDDAPVIEDAATREIYQFAARVAQTDATVLVTGESGTGKEVLARYIHRQSDRHDKPFVALNCAAIPESMLEAMLFGHEKGAFTSAHQAAPGKFEQANGGTLLLDEISEMDIGLQAKLLRVLQEREVERLGGRKTIALDVRVIATSNRDLKAQVANGSFREDLYYRLSVFPLELPPLRQRPEDILPLAMFLLQRHAAKLRRAPVQLSNDACEALHAYNWPGNIRELDNLLQRALVLQTSTLVGARDLFFDQVARPGPATAMATNTVPRATSAPELPGADTADNQALETSLRQTEYQLILDTLQRCRGSKKDTARQLGVSPRTLRYKMAQMRELGMLDV